MIIIDSDIIKRSIEHYGKDVQSTVCMEECAELIQAISKEKRGKSDKDHLAEEMADVLICIEMLKQIYNITEDEIYSWVITKQERTIKRIKKDVQSTETNADRIRNMSDDELAEWITNMGDFEKFGETYKSIYNLDTEEEEEIHDSYGDLLKWLQSEAEVIELKDATEIVNNTGVSDYVCEWKVFDNSLTDEPQWVYETTCGKYVGEEHTSKAFVYCPYCSKKIKAVE